jgi:hypothetical protein
MSTSLKEESMKKLIAFCLVLAAAGMIVACSPGASSSTPVSPQTASFSAGEERRNVTPVLLCHYAKGDDPQWVVIEVDNNSNKYAGHVRHGDYTTSSCSTLVNLAVEDNCTCCTTNSCDDH